jgi:hypothetical protein
MMISIQCLRVLGNHPLLMVLSLHPFATIFSLQDHYKTTPSPCPYIIILYIIYIERIENDRGLGVLEADVGVDTAGIISGISGQAIFLEGIYYRPELPRYSRNYFHGAKRKMTVVRGAENATKRRYWAVRNSVRKRAVLSGHRVPRFKKEGK